MEFPFGHHPHSHVRTHQHRREEDDEGGDDRRNYPPPPSFPDSAYPPPPFSGFPHRPSYDYPSDPPPPPVSAYSNDDYPPSDTHHGYRRPADDYAAGGGRISHPSEAPPPPVSAYSNDDYPPSDANHGYRRPADDYAAGGGRISHDSGESEIHHGYHPHMPSFLQHHSHQSASALSTKPTYKIITKANPDYALTIRDGHVILAPSDPSDDAQHWYKDEKYSTRVKDEEGFPCFALVNKATGEAMKHSVGASHPVNLVAYNSEVLDESVLWTQGKDVGDGFKTIRMINNIRLLVDAFHGDKKSGGVRDGTTVVLWQWNKGDNQMWKILPYCKFPNP